MLALATQNTSPVPQGVPQRVSQFAEGSSQSLGINSTLSELPLFSFSITAEHAIQHLVEQFKQWPDLPGVIILEASRSRVLSRQQLLECLLQLGQDFDADGPIRTMLHYANRKALKLPGHISILVGAQQALKRDHEQQSDPILVGQEGDFLLLDARTLNVAHWQIRGIETQIRYERLQMQLLQSEKMAALGRLVDGVAHEILDPVSFIWGNLSYIDSYAKQQEELIAAYEASLPMPSADILAIKEAIEFDYLRSDLPAAIKSARGGAHRLRQLATSLQNFCHIDDVHPRPCDLNTLIDSTLRLLKSRLTSPIEIKRCYGKLPPIPCFAGQLSQVFMNLFTNAIDSLLAQAQLESYIADNAALHARKVPQITVTTCVQAAKDVLSSDPDESRWVSIIISDNGPGLLPATRAQIMDSFSTERRSVKETGLAMSYQIITAKHGGRFWLRSFHTSEQPNDQGSQSPTGTEFEILLPLTFCENA
jgi:signal transduction histidine kinase